MNTVFKCFFCAALLLSMCTVNAGGNNNIVLTGTNNQSIDRMAIQSAINSASPGATVILKGTFQLDGTAISIVRPNLKIIGSGGDKNNNWGTVISGLLRSDGTPQRNFGAPTFSLNNVGFLLLHGSSNITIQGIKFVNLNIPVQIAPQVVSYTSSLCSSFNVLPSGGANYSIMQNWIDNSNRPISGFGKATNVSITNNRISNSGFTFFDIVLAGTNSVGCTATNGQGGFVTQALPGLLNPSQVLIQKNDFDTDNAIDQIALLIAENVLVSGNNISAGANTECSVLARTNNGLITLNNVDLGNAGLCGIAVDAATAAPFTNPVNIVSFNNVLNGDPTIGIGVGMDDGITGVLALGNIFHNIGAAEYLLCDANADSNAEAEALCDGTGVATSNNTVISSSKYRVMNLGVNNKIIIIK